MKNFNENNNAILREFSIHGVYDFKFGIAGFND